MKILGSVMKMTKKLVMSMDQVLSHKESKGWAHLIFITDWPMMHSGIKQLLELTDTMPSFTAVTLSPKMYCFPVLHKTEKKEWGTIASQQTPARKIQCCILSPRKPRS
jgi:hypothetical protein